VSPGTVSEALPRELLARGFEFGGARVPLVGPQGIFKPAALPDVPLTITTAPQRVGHARPYEDELSEDGLLLYRYRGTDPHHRDNMGLRLAWQRRTPLVYLAGVLPGQYMPFWPVFIVDDDPHGLCFLVDVSADAAGAAPLLGGSSHADEGHVFDPRSRFSHPTLCPR